MRVFHLFIVLFIVLIFSGCVDDSSGECPVDIENNFILKFRYVSDEPEELFIEKIKRVDVFVFKDDGQYVMTQSADLAALTSFAGITLDLDPGSYRIVCWGNASEKTFISPLSTNSMMKDAFVSHTALRSGTTATNGDTLYYALDHTILSPSLKAITVSETVIERILDFHNAFVKVQVYVKGLVDKNPQGNLLPPIVEMNGVTSGYNFEMQTFGNAVRYLNTTAFEYISGETVAAITFYTPRFKDDNPIEIKIKKSSDGSTLTAINLKDFMRENNITVEGIEEAVVPILVEYKEASVEISIPEWGQIPVDPEL
ncbi:FimB/Mfa2 family fimbrial subunit [uncultured Dysgonomonas sp.]|uniref:Fimbrillin-A associated anchor proteins Mfa1 and Mfa2 n=1 Tax=uncultured Dysgonomonas sp. TaxID=206096 RepID=A0A212K5B0_9BACT|nr:FimB/Mfa2 family fimbrial subunit [uncultured Dysgonomonas sp.]SBW06891.1 conserved exported hypothetical protein [uncultured Dysgonomonas sp.]